LGSQPILGLVHAQLPDWVTAGNTGRAASLTLLFNLEENTRLPPEKTSAPVSGHRIVQWPSSPSRCNLTIQARRESGETQVS